MAKTQRTSGTLRFIGQRGPDGKATEYLSGIPARDMTSDDLANIPEETISAMIASNLYAWDTGTKSAPTKVAEISIDEEMSDGNE